MMVPIWRGISEVWVFGGGEILAAVENTWLIIVRAMTCSAGMATLIRLATEVKRKLAM